MLLKVKYPVLAMRKFPHNFTPNIWLPNSWGCNPLDYYVWSTVEQEYCYLLSLDAAQNQKIFSGDECVNSHIFMSAQSAGNVEYADCTSAEE